MRRIFQVAGVAALMLGATLAAPSGQAADQRVLELEMKILLGSVRGRIDHLAVDTARHLLFVAELGNDSLSVVDLRAGRVLHRITGLKEPQGVGYVPSTDTIYVANAGDGSVRLSRAEDYAQAGRIELGADADNVRVDLARNLVLVGYGGGGIAIIDPLKAAKIADIPLPAHPEGFQLMPDSDQVFVNLTQQRSVVTLDRAGANQTASWMMTSGRGNYPMALDAASRHVIVVFRDPAKLAVLDMRDGVSVAERETCGDADDVFFDARRNRVYVSCGDGFIDVFDAAGGAYRPLARMPTVRGARTSLLIPPLDRFALAAPAAAGESAAIWLFRPVP